MVCGWAGFCVWVTRGGRTPTDWPHTGQSGEADCRGPEAKPHQRDTPNTPGAVSWSLYCLPLQGCSPGPPVWLFAVLGRRSGLVRLLCSSHDVLLVLRLAVVVASMQALLMF